MAKSVPAIGAPKTAAMPPAAPHAASVRTRRSEKRRLCPTAEPRAAPTRTMGPSRPAEPPLPTVSDVAMILLAATRRRMRPPRKRDGFDDLGHAAAPHLRRPSSAR